MAKFCINYIKCNCIVFLGVLVLLLSTYAYGTRILPTENNYPNSHETNGQYINTQQISNSEMRITDGTQVMAKDQNYLCTRRSGSFSGPCTAFDIMKCNGKCKKENADHIGGDCENVGFLKDVCVCYYYCP